MVINAFLREFALYSTVLIQVSEQEQMHLNGLKQEAELRHVEMVSSLQDQLRRSKLLRSTLSQQVILYDFFVCVRYVFLTVGGRIECERANGNITSTSKLMC